MQTYLKNIYSSIKTLIVGMKVSLKHFNNKKELVATLQYPHEKWPIPERNIGFEEKDYNLIRSRLHVDIDDCIGCLQCERACPVDCIKIDTIKPPKGSDYDCGMTSNDTQKKMIVSRFTIDMAECCYCNLCAYPCPEECIYMVGGPNSHKHDMDYEFGKYERDGLLYEFADATDDEIIAVGGEKYLEKKRDRANELDNALELVAMAAEKAQQEVDKDEEKSTETKSDTPAVPKYNFESLNKIADKPARGLAKRAFARGHREDKDPKDVVGMIKSDLEKANRYSADYEPFITAVGDAPLVILPEGAEPEPAKEEVKAVEVPVEETSKTTAETTKSEAQEVKATPSGIPDIKILNDISDKMARGIAKKAFTAAKREKLDTAGFIAKIEDALKDADKSADEYSEIINKLAE